MICGWMRDVGEASYIKFIDKIKQFITVLIIIWVLFGYYCHIIYYFIVHMIKHYTTFELKGTWYNLHKKNILPLFEIVFFPSISIWLWSRWQPHASASFTSNLIRVVGCLVVFNGSSLGHAYISDRGPWLLLLVPLLVEEWMAVPLCFAPGQEN